MLKDFDFVDIVNDIVVAYNLEHTTRELVN